MVSTPSWIAFSSVDKPRRQLVEELLPLLQANEMYLQDVSRLRWDPEVQEIEYMGMAGLGNVLPCKSEAEALQRTEDWDGVVFSYRWENTSIHFYFWEWQQQHCVAIEIAPGVLYPETNEFANGQWLKQLLISFMDAARAGACGYGSLYRINYKPLDPEYVLANLRNGYILNAYHPCFHMVSLELIGADEVRSILDSHEKHPRLDYAMTTFGYHVFSILP